MPRKTIKRFLPDPQFIRGHKHLAIFGVLLNNANLWHINRRSASGAFAIGLFIAFLPMPFQMFLAAAIAIMLRVNLPLSVALVWVSNPLTMPPLFYGAYRLGAFLLGNHPQAYHFEMSWHWLLETCETIGPTFLFGCVVAGLLFGLLGYVGIRLLWRLQVSRNWQKRRSRKLPLLSISKSAKSK